MNKLALIGKQVWNKTFGRIMVFILMALIRSYQILLSPRIGPVCRYYPTCSHYGLAAVKVHGAFKGSVLTIWRISRCHPWAAGGVEFIPEKGNWTSKKKIENSTNNDRQVVGV